MAEFQSPGEQERLIKQGKDGIILCVDINHPESKESFLALIEKLPELSPICRIAEQLPTQEKYVIALITHNPNIIVRAIVATSVTIKAALQNIVEKSGEYGTLFAFVLMPGNPTIETILAELQQSQNRLKI